MGVPLARYGMYFTEPFVKTPEPGSDYIFLFMVLGDE